MSTPTPRTDAAVKLTFAAGHNTVCPNFARTLERELTALAAERDELRADCDNETKWAAHYLAEWIAVKAERDQLRAENATLRAAQKACEACDEPTAFEVRQLRARAERAEAELADWSVLKGWGGTPEIVHKFIKGQQHRIHYCQNLEADLATERARLDAGTILLTVAGERVWHCGVDLRAAIDAGMREDAK